MDRRSFIKLTAISGTSATLASCGVPENEIIRFVPEEELVPGVAEWKPGVCPLCGSGCGLSVRVMQADVETVRNGLAGVVRAGVAKKFEGAPDHPVNGGGLCARGQAGLQITYHPDRLVQPLKRKGDRGAADFEVITWDAAIAELVSKLDALEAASTQASLAFVTNGHRSQRHTLIDQFVTKFGAPAAITYELFGDDVLRHANLLSFGRAQLPTFNLKNARHVIGFGADFLGTWNSPVSQMAGYGAMRQGRPGIRGSFVQCEARMTTTGACADEWVAINPGTEGVLALGIAHVILEHKLRPAPASTRAAAQVAGWSTGLTDYEPPKVAAITGVSAERIERLAHDFAERAPAVAIVGGTPLAHTNGLFTALAVNALNELAGAVATPGGVFFTPQPSAAPSQPARQSLDKFATAVGGGSQSVGLLLVDGTNPIFSAPTAWKVKEAFARAAYIVSFSSFIDETSAMADLILPDSSFLESWTDMTPESGSMMAVMSVAAPPMKPLFQTRPTPDLLLEVAGKLRKPLGLPWTTFEEMLTASFNAIGEDAWSSAQSKGGWWGELPRPAVAAGGATAPRSAPVAIATAFNYVAPTFDGDAGQYPYHFLPYASTQFLDGSLSHLPWLQELPDPMTSAMWSSWIEINPKTAEMLGIHLGDVVEVTSSVGSLTAPAFINPAIAPNLIAMPVGQGHTNFTRYASGRGRNPVEILAAVSEPTTGALAWAATRVKISRVGDPDGRFIMFSAGGELREKPLEHQGGRR